LSLAPATGQIRDTKLGSTTHGQQGPSSGLQTRTARIRLTVRPKPYHFTPIAPGIAIGYRRNMGPGVGVARIADGKGGNWTRTVGLADEFEDARRHQRPDVLAGDRQDPQTGAGLG
jgi:hypothetical protein